MEKLNRTIYICSTYHHVHVSLIKCLVNGQAADILICDDIPGYIELQCSLIKAQVFRHVYFFNRTFSPGYNPKDMTKRLFGRHKKHKKLVENELKIDLTRYDNIYIFHDGIKIARYMMDCGIYFNLIEDGLDHFKHIQYVPSKADLPTGNRCIVWLKKTFNIGYLFCGQSKYCKSIEVNSKDGLVIKHGNIIEVPKRWLYSLVNEEQKQLIYKIFLGNMRLPENGEQKSALLFTVPLYQEKFVKTREMHIQIYRDIIQQLHTDGFKVYIKPHPRDNLEYEKVYHNVQIITKEIPSEILNYNAQLHFDKAIAIASASIKNVDFADEVIDLNYEYLNNYPEYLSDWLRETFQKKG